MMKSFKRSHRIADQIKRDASEVISDMLRDRNDLMITVSGVEVTNDLKYAKIFYTVLGDNADKLERSESFFKKSTGYIRGEIARRLRIRKAPEISLHYDKSLVEGLRIAGLIDKVASDRMINEIRREIIDVLLNSKHVLLAGHKDPDGDSLGSQLGLAGFLRNQNVAYKIINEGTVPDKYKFLPGVDEFLDINDVSDTGDRFDTAVALECSNLERMGEVGRLIDKECTIINIDHHQDNIPFGHINMKIPEASAVGEMIYDLLRQGAFSIDRDMAINLYTAILTDTGRFHFNNTTSHSLRTAADLLECGADPVQITEEVYYRETPARMLLTGMVLSGMEYLFDNRLCVMTIDREMMERISADKSDTEGIVNYSLSAAGVEVGALFSEIASDVTKVSLRSQDLVDVAEIAAHYGGGGHYNASGFILRESLKEAKETVIGYLKDRLNGSV